MWIRQGTLIAATLALMLASPPLLAQRGGRQTPARPDTAKKASPSVSLDFQEQELKVVLDALAAAGDLNVSMTNIPSQRITVHMGRPVNRDGMIEVLKNVSEANGLKFTQSPTMIQISGVAPEPRNTQTPQQILQQQLAQANQAQQVRLFTYRLRHASAVQLAPVLTNLFSGLTTQFGNNAGRAGFTVPNGNGGFTTIQTNPPGNIQTFPNGVQQNGGAGRGGRGGQAAQAQVASDAAAVAQAQAQGGRGNQIANAINSIFQATSGSLSNQAGEIRIIAEESSNSLLVRATDADWALVQQIISGVDLRPLQVLIEVTIAEVTRTRALDLGVSGTVKRTEGKNSVTASSPSLASARDFILQLTGGRGTINYDVAINALQERGDVRVLSLPIIIAQNNRQASLNVGSSRPFVQISQTVPNDPTGRVQTVQYIDVGTVLTITPTINPDGYVNLQVTQTDNSATNEVQFDAPIINKREAQTQVFIRDGQTTVIGGLAGNTKTRQDSGIPLISRIPLIGTLLFGNTSRTDDTTELFLFLTPHVISSDDDVDKLWNAIRDGSDLLRQMNIGPYIIPRADTIPVPTIMRPPSDSTKKDSLTTLRRRPPGL